MRVADVIGTVTLSRAHPLVVGGTWLVVVPQSLANLRGTSTKHDEPLVAYDVLGAGHGARIAISEGAEAGAPFDEPKPLDAYNACILDSLETIEFSEKPN